MTREGKIQGYSNYRKFCDSSKLPFLPKFRQLPRFAAIFIEKSIIFNRFYVEISIILEYIYIEISIISEENGEEACSNARHTTN